MSSFEYTPLQDLDRPQYVGNSGTVERSESLVDGNWEIRLLRVSPSKSQDAPISCDLLQTPLSTIKGVYDALSYVWADSTGLSSLIYSVCCISVCGFELTVTPNLYAALVRLRYEDRDRLLWIDQICINQADIQERNVQVERMTLIYGFASKTVVWLGEELEESYRGMHLAQSLAHLRIQYKADTDGLFASVVAELSDISEWKALDLILQRSWWCRTWVVQECVVARSVIMLCGSREISFTDLTKAVLLIEELKDHRVMSECVSKVNTAPVSELLTSRTRTAQVRAEGELAWEPVFGFDGLSKVLSRYRTRHSTDPRDKVYALLRISRDIRDAARVPACYINPIRIDYSKSVEDIYYECASFLLMATNRLDFLSACRTKRKLVDMPSWVPDWSDTTEAPFSITDQDRHTATGDDVFCSAYIQDRQLNALGILFDRVMFLGAPCSEADLSQPYPSVTLCQWKALALDQGHNEEDFMRTIIADCFRSRRLSTYALPSCWHLYQIWDGHVVATGDVDNCETSIGTEIVLETLDFVHALRKASLGRRFCISERGVACLAPEDTAEGDLLVGLLGARVPYVIRATGTERYVLIGEWWV